MKKTITRSKVRYATTLLLSITLAATPYNAIITAFAAENTTTNNIIDDIDYSRFGTYVGQFFKELNFENLEGISVEKIDQKLIKNLVAENYKSARWKTSFTVTQDGHYSIKAPEGLEIFVGDTNITNNTTSLKAEYAYDLYLVAKDLSHVDLNSSFEINTINNKTKTIDKLITQESDDKGFHPFISTTQTARAESNNYALDCGDSLNKSIDNDNDLIPDCWEIEGYTRKPGTFTIISWKTWEETGDPDISIPKYFSNPLSKFTANDPFNDLDKTTGKMDPLIDKTAHHPMVAAVPSFSTAKEKIILSKNQNVTSETGTGSDTTSGSNSSNSHNSSTTESLTVEAGASIMGPSGSISGTMSGSESNTAETGTNHSDTTHINWSNALSMQESEAAYVNANIRYYNHGTAPIYDAQPTINFVLGQSDTITTLRMKENQIAKVLQPQAPYPAPRHSALALLTQDDFGSTPIEMNKEQVDRLTAGEPLRLQTTEYSGKIGIYSASSGNIEFYDEWGYRTAGIYKKTAGISIDLQDGTTMERRIAARDSYDMYDLTPRLTVREAIKIGFGAKENPEKDLLFYNKNEDKEYVLNEDSIFIIIDEATQENIEKQIQEDPNISSIYDAFITPDTAIHIQPAEFYTNFRTHITNEKYHWEGLDTISQSGKTYALLLDGKTATLNTAGLRTEDVAVFSAGIKCSVGYGTAQINNSGKTENIDIEDTLYKIETTRNIPDRLSIKAQGCDVLFDYTSLYDSGIRQKDYLATPNIKAEPEGSGNLYYTAPEDSFVTGYYLYINGHRIDESYSADLTHNIENDGVLWGKITLENTLYKPGDTFTIRAHDRAGATGLDSNTITIK